MSDVPKFEWIPAQQHDSDDWVAGRCAICWIEGAVRLCRSCSAVVCAYCRHRWFKRGKAMVESLFHETYRGEVLRKVA